jgi:XTP/dITP diphosphohydrolase
MQKIILASGNQHKLEEFQQIMSNTQYIVANQAEFDVPEPEETGLTFVENAILKARNACHYTKLPTIADDSGLEVDTLKGAPGIYSARYAGKKASNSDNNSKLLFELQNVPQELRTARFQCVIVYLRHEFDPTPIICQGTWHGSILFEPAGKNGFGYDPIFYVPTHECSAAELPPEIKNQISHRSQALRMLVDILQSSVISSDYVPR